jgi:hypothetical protein
MASFARTRLCGRTISRSAPVEIRCAKRSAGSTSKGLSRSGRGEGTSSPDGAGGDYRGLRHAHGARGTCGFHGRRLHLCRIINTLRDSAESYIRLSVESTGLGEAWAMHQEMFEGFRRRRCHPCRAALSTPCPPLCSCAARTLASGARRGSRRGIPAGQCGCDSRETAAGPDRRFLGLGMTPGRVGNPSRF